MENQEKNTQENQAGEFIEDSYILIVGSLITVGPKLNASKEELNKFFANVKKYNEEQGKEVVRYFKPNVLK